MLPEHRKEFVRKLKYLLEELDRADVDMTGASIKSEYYDMGKEVTIRVCYRPEQVKAQ